MPNYELLKEAYAIIDGIPADRFNLSQFSNEHNNPHDCNTIACAAGWLGMHPKFKALGMATDKKGCLTGTGWYWQAVIGRVFDISDSQANYLFGARPNLIVNMNLTDKEVWLRRVREFLKDGHA